MAALNLSKVTSFMTTNGYTPYIYYRIGSEVKYIEAYSNSSAAHFLVCIPMGVVLSVTTEPASNVIELIPKEIGNVVDRRLLESMYPQVETGKMVGTDILEERLIGMYRKPIESASMSTKINERMESTVRQLERMLYSMEGTGYGLAIRDGRFMVIGEKLDTFIRDINTAGSSLLVTVDMGVFTDRVSVVGSDITDILRSFRDMYSSNGVRHVELLNNIMDRREDILGMSASIRDRNIRYSELLGGYEDMLRELVDKEEVLVKKIHSLEAKPVGDVTLAHIKGTAYDDLHSLKATRVDLLVKLRELRVRYDTLMLVVDNVLFDNIISLNSAIMKLDSLQKL
jgi:hypothetical protein